MAAAPEYFRLVNGWSSPVTENVVGDDLVLAAAELCPLGAITIHDSETGRVLAAGED